MCESTISMAMFNSYVKLPEGIRYTCAYIYIYHYISALIDPLVGLAVFPCDDQKASS